MNGMKRRKKMNTPMLEIIITLAILMLVSVCILKLFVGANSLETKARDISKATILAETIGETIKGYDTVSEAAKELGLIQIQNNYSASMYEKYYDSAWNACDKPSVYRVIVDVQQEEQGTGMMVTADIRIIKEKDYMVIQNKDHRELIKLQVKSYKENV